MFKPFFRRQISVMMLMSLLVLTFALSACGGDSTTAASSGGTTHAISITEKTGGQDIYTFDPATLAIKAGDSVKWTNDSDENHKLVISPAGPTPATASKSGSNDNTATVTFPTAGTYTVTSQLVDRLKDGQHTPDPADSKATVTITVS